MVVLYLPQILSVFGHTVAGAGLELAHTSNVSFKIEYLAYMLDGETISAAPLGGNVVIDDQTIHTVRAGLNYRF